MTLHADEEMGEDGLSVYDVERGTLSGVILERQHDRLSGQTVAGGRVEVVAKIGPTNLLVIMTVYALGETETEWFAIFAANKESGSVGLPEPLGKVKTCWS